MPTIAESVRVDEGRVGAALSEAQEKLEGAEGEIALDFSAVRRIDASAVRALQEFAMTTRRKGVKVCLRGVTVEVYKVLTLMRLASRFSFAG
jgi:anti-anti-sigma regulatory factor